MCISSVGTLVHACGLESAVMARQLLIAAFGLAALVPGQDLVGDELQQALQDNVAAFWVYDDLPAAEKMAAERGKPLLITFRCVP